MPRFSFRRLALPALAATLLMAPVHGFDRLTGAPHASRSEVIAPNAIAATSQPLATEVALEILRKGGSAVDAAIAANAMLGLVEPTGCGIGGDLYAIVWDADKGELTGLNASGRSPRSLSLATFKDQGLESIPPRGPLPVSVPGAVDGWFELHARYGKLPMAEVLAPAIRYAENGFPVSELIAYYWARNARVLAEYAGFTDTFMPGSASPHCMTCAQLVSSTQRPISTMRPVSSAIGMKWKGDTSPSSGWRQRMSDSTPSSSPVVVRTCGW